MLIGICIVSFFSGLLCEVAAVPEFLAPTDITVVTGSSNSTNPLSVLYNDSNAIIFNSNRSGDRNYYEAYDMSSQNTFNTYFDVIESTWSLPVDFKEEKSDNAGHMHKKIMRIKDDYYDGYNLTSYWSNQRIMQKQAIVNASVNQTEGYLEFYFLSESTNGTFMVTFGDFKYKRYYNQTQWSMTGKGYGISFGIAPLSGAADSTFFCQTSWDGPHTAIPASSMTYHSNTWYHVQLVFKYNKWWGININSINVYNSTNWTSMNPSLKIFNYMAMFTSTKTYASRRPTHVFYIDAIGISYNTTAHNLVSTMDFITPYDPYVNVYSKNNLNDHDVAASLAVYYRFNFGDRVSRSSSAKLHIAGYFTHMVDTGKILLYDREDLVYDVFYEGFTPFPDTPAYEFEFSATKTSFLVINSSIYVDSTGKFAMKVEASSDNNFEFILNYLTAEFFISASMGEVSIIIFAVLALVGVFFIYKIVGGARYSGRSRRTSRSRYNRR